MNSKDNLMPTNVSSIITNFSDLVKNFSIKETEWQIKKEEYEQRISELEGEVKAHENINIDLLKRIRMLEYALSQERAKNNNKGENINVNIPQDNSLFNDLGPQNLIKEEDLKFLRETSNRHSMINVLQSIGIDENLANNLFTDFELNRTELEAMIKKNLDEKLAKTGKDNISQIVNNKGSTQNNTSNNNYDENNNNEIMYKDNNKTPKHGSGVGVINVHSRIKLMFGNEYGLSVESEADEGTKVTIHIPAIPYNESNLTNLEKQNVERKVENEKK